MRSVVWLLLVFFVFCGLPKSRGGGDCLIHAASKSSPWANQAVQRLKFQLWSLPLPPLIRRPGCLVCPGFTRSLRLGRTNRVPGQNQGFCPPVPTRPGPGPGAALVSMVRLKEICVLLDNCHPRTAKRWWKKLGVPPTVTGHGAHRWTPDDAQKLYARWALWRRHENSTPEFLRDEYKEVFSPFLFSQMLERAVCKAKQRRKLNRRRKK